MPDGTRADCVTDDYAVEIDFADKWAESIGQAQHYGRLTGKRPGILLILEDPRRDQRHLDRLLGTVGVMCPKVRVWTITPSAVRGQPP